MPVEVHELKPLLGTGTALAVTGTVELLEGRKQAIEIKVASRRAFHWIQKRAALHCLLTSAGKTRAMPVGDGGAEWRLAGRQQQSNTWGSVTMKNIQFTPAKCRWSTCGLKHICVRGPTPSALCCAFATRWPTRRISFSMSVTLRAASLLFILRAHRLR